MISTDRYHLGEELAIQLFTYSVIQWSSAPPSSALSALRRVDGGRHRSLFQRHLHECQQYLCLPLPSGSPIELKRCLRGKAIAKDEGEIVIV